MQFQFFTFLQRKGGQKLNFLSDLQKNRCSRTWSINPCQTIALFCWRFGCVLYNLNVLRSGERNNFKIRSNLVNIFWDYLTFNGFNHTQSILQIYSHKNRQFSPKETVNYRIENKSLISFVCRQVMNGLSFSRNKRKNSKTITHQIVCKIFSEAFITS